MGFKMREYWVKGEGRNGERESGRVGEWGCWDDEFLDMASPMGSRDKIQLHLKRQYLCRV
jgi:hypothetical protein